MLQSPKWRAVSAKTRVGLVGLEKNPLDYTSSKQSSHRINPLQKQ